MLIGNSRHYYSISSHFLTLVPFSFDTLKRSFVGVHKVIQANAQDECDQKYVEEILIATDRT